MLTTSKAELRAILQHVGLSEGQTVMIHAAVLSLGLMEGGINGFLQTVRDVIGPAGNMLFPTFTYSFRKNEVFDVRAPNIPVEIGALPRHVHRHSLGQRSLDPMFSMIALGPEQELLTRRPSKRCFGEGSPYGDLFERNIMFLCLGIDYTTGLTAFMHIENEAQVPYRYEQVFAGTTIDQQGKAFDDSAVHFVKDVEFFQAHRSNRNKVGLVLEEKGISRLLQRHGHNFFALPARPFYDCVRDELHKNPYCMVEKR